MEQAYGMTARIYEKLEIGEAERRHTDAELAAYFSQPEHLYLLDFTLPMFETEYFEEETTAYVREGARSFTEYCIKEYGRRKTYQLCMDVSEKGREVLAEWKNEWLEEIGGTAEYEEFAKLPFTYNNSKPKEGYPYVVKGDMANWYFATADIRNLGYETLVEDYVKITPLADLDFAEAQEVLKEYIAEKVPPAHIFTAFNAEKLVAGASGVYVPFSDIIYIHEEWALTYSLLHEYVHYLTSGNEKLFSEKKGLMEGVTTEIACFECENRLEKLYWKKFITEEDIMLSKEVGIWDENLCTLKIDGLRYYGASQFYNRQIEGEYRAMSLILMPEQPEKITMSSLNYYAAASMVHYLIGLYGRDRVFECCTDNDKLEELCGKSFDEIYEEWGQWNEQKCLEMKKLLH